MPDLRALDELAQRLSASIPVDLGAARADLAQNFRALLQTGLRKLDLVTREEFDVQSAVLRRTREKLETLERRLAELEGGAGG